MIKMPMDPDLYDAAVEVMDAIEEKLDKADRRATEEDVLGRSLAIAYQRWRTRLICKYATTTEKPAPSASIVADMRTMPTKQPTITGFTGPTDRDDPIGDARSAVEKRKLHPWRNPPRNPRGKI